MISVTWMPRPTDEQFALAAPLLQRVVDKATKGEFTVEDIRRMAQRGRVLVGVACRDGKPVMAAAMELVHYPRLTALNVMALAGTGLAEIAEQFFGEMKAFAKSCGAQRIEASSSPAMARLLARIGFEPLYEKVGCEL